MESGIREAIVGWDDFRNWHVGDVGRCLILSAMRQITDISPSCKTDANDPNRKSRLMVIQLRELPCDGASMRRVK
jgi:hypothetical protein